MQIPLLSRFIDGLKLFFANKRLRWFFIVFMLSVLYISALAYVGGVLSQDPLLRPSVVFITIVSGGIWPVFFLLVALVSLAGLQRFVASDESYAKSLFFFFPWMVLSIIALIVLALFVPLLLIALLYGVAFIGWISYQAYFATRTSLGYAEIADTQVTGALRVLAYFSHLVSYALIVGALVYVLLLTPAALATKALVLVGSLLVLGFNFVNGIIMARHRNKPTLVNVALIGLFISAYSAYFIYSASIATYVFDPVGWLITMFFVLYTMSGVGRALSSRAHMDTRFKLSAEPAAAVTFFMASGYYFANSLTQIVLADPNFGASVSGIIKLFLFPFIALLMESLYLRKRGRPVPAPEAVVTPPESGPQPEVAPEEPVVPSQEPGDEQKQPESDAQV